MAEQPVTLDALRGSSGEGRHPALDATARVLSSPVGLASAVVLALVVLGAIFADIARDPYEAQRAAPTADGVRSFAVFSPPSLEHPFGTDINGRDVLARVMQGARISLWVGFLATTGGCLVGAAWGLLSGFAGSWFDLVSQRVVDAMLAIPGLVLALIFAAVFTPSVTTGIFAIILIIIPFNARVIRSAVLAVKENVYVEAARVIGADPTRIMLRHILPNVVAPILIMMSTVLGAAIIVEAGLAFLGMGAQIPEPSWGLMLREGRAYLEVAWWWAFFPAVAISVTVLAANLLGDVIRDVLDPRLRGSR